MIISCDKRNFYSGNYINRYQGDNQVKIKHAAFQNTEIVLFFWFSW